MLRRVPLFLIACIFTTSSANATSITFISSEGDLAIDSNSGTISGEWSVTAMQVVDGVLPDPASYDVDGVVPSNDPFNDTNGTLSFLIDGCVPGQLLLSLDCTPTSSSYLRIFGSIPDLSLSYQQLLSGDFVGGRSEVYSSAISFYTLRGGGTDTKSTALLTALGIDPLLTWQFEFSKPIIPAFDPVRVTNVGSDEITPVPEPTSLVLLGTGALGLIHRLRARRGSQR